jgi:hypothetical protein
MKAGVCSSPSFRASRCFAGLTRQWKNQPLRVVRFLRLLLLFWVTAVAVGTRLATYYSSILNVVAGLPSPGAALTSTMWPLGS